MRRAARRPPARRRRRRIGAAAAAGGGGWRGGAGWRGGEWGDAGGSPTPATAAAPTRAPPARAPAGNGAREASGLVGKLPRVPRDLNIRDEFHRYFLAHQQINAINPRCVRRDGWPAERGEMWRAVGLCVAFLPLAAPAAPAAALLLGSQLSAATTAAVASALAAAAAAATSASGASVGRSASELATSFASLASDLAAAASRTARSSLGAAVHRCLLSHSPIFRFCHSPCFLYNQRHLV